MSERIRISATNLGRIALPHFCERCFWVWLRMDQKRPFDSFPGIFSSIDAYTKRVVHGWFDEFKSPPPWLHELGEISGYVEPPHWSKFSIVDEQHNIQFRGEADGILRRSDGSHVIIDYKTAKHSGNQDALYPAYEAQLNAYARIGNELEFDPVTDLALIYMEPVTGDAAASDGDNRRTDGFAMGFAADIVTVPVNPEILEPLLAKTREIFELNHAPDGRSGCTDCERVAQMGALL
ncbi:MAG: PD-(D/E)XK nuclease family protein [Dehalococcoidia bacterium]